MKIFRFRKFRRFCFETTLNFIKIDLNLIFLITRIGYVEVYNEQFYDLLSTLQLSNATEFSTGLSIFDDRGDVFVKGLNYQPVSNEEEALNLLFEVNLIELIGSEETVVIKLSYY